MKIFFSVLLCCLIFGACNEVEVASPDFDVTAESQTVKAGGQVVFKFTGDPDQISFFSGEPFLDYAFKDGRVLTAEGLSLSFTTSVQFGTQSDQLSVLASNDFNGSYTMSDIKKATWVDMTKDYPLATTTTARVWGVKDLKSMLVVGKPIYIAFRYKTLPQAKNGAQRSWTIGSFNLLTNTSIGVQTLEDHAGSGFKLIHEGPLESGRSSVGTANIVFRGNVADTETPTEDWVITKPVNVGKLDKGPDRPDAIKGFVDTKSYDYKYIYKTPGNYKATFVATNSNVYGTKEVVRQVDIAVTP